jgi:hypothetical protein
MRVMLMGTMGRKRVRCIERYGWDVDASLNGILFDVPI